MGTEGCAPTSADGTTIPKQQWVRGVCPPGQLRPADCAPACLGCVIRMQDAAWWEVVFDRFRITHSTPKCRPKAGFGHHAKVPGSLGTQE